MKTKKKTVLNRNRNRVLACFCAPGIFLYSLFFIFPVGLGIWYSMTDWSGIAVSNNFVGLTNYVKAFSNRQFQKSILFTIKYTACYTVCLLVLATIEALLLNAKVKGNTTFRAILFVPAILSGVSVGLVFEQLYYHVVPRVGQALGIEWLSKSLLGQKETAMWAVLFVALWCALAMNSILILAGLQNVAVEWIEAAAIDGATPWQRFRYITIPHLIPTLNVVMVLSIKAGLMTFDLFKVLTGGGPNKATTSVAMLIYQNAFENNKYSLAMAEAMIIGVIIATISFIQLKVNNKKGA